MFTRVFVSLSVAIVAAAQPASNTFPIYDAANGGPAASPQHGYSGLSAPRSERWDNINPADTGSFPTAPKPAAGPVSVEQLRHPLTGKALGMIRKAESLIAAKNYAVARELLHKATKDSSAAPYAHSLLGQEYVRAMQFPEAVAELEQAVRLLSSNVADHANLGYALMMTNRLSESEKEIQRALELQPGNPRTHLVMGVLCYSLGNRDEEAEEHLLFAARELPSAHLMLARFYQLTGRTDVADRELQAFERLSGSIDIGAARAFMSGEAIRGTIR